MDKIIALILAIVLLIPAALLGGNIAFREVEGVRRAIMNRYVRRR